MFEQLRDHWTACGERYRDGEERREHRREMLETGGDWREIENGGRLRNRLRRKGMADSMAEGLVAQANENPAFGTLLLERIIAESELLEVWFLMVGARLARSVARVQIRASSGRLLGHGTGFLVSPDLMMTNNHVLSSASEAAPSVAQFDFFERPGGAPTVTAEHQLEPGRFFRTSRALDFTLVAVAPLSENGRPLAARPWNSLIRESGKALIGEAVNIIQHPRAETMKVAFRQNKIVDRLDNFLHYSTDTDRGSSGSQVCNDRWEIAALHHAGVPRMDADRRILLTDGTVWNGSRATASRIDWIANEGIRISRIVSHLDGLALSDDERAIYDRSFEPSPLLFPEIAPSGGAPEGDDQPVTRRTEPDGSVSWYFRVNFGPAGGTAPPSSTPQPTPPPSPADGARSDPALARAQDIIDQARPDRPYFDCAANQADIDSYYDKINLKANPTALFNALKKLLKDTHTTRLSYKTARHKHLYPWVDLRDGGNLRNIYSGTILDPAEVIAQELERFELARPGFLSEFSISDLDRDDEALSELELLMEASLPFNCEHVVPQSWFDKRQPMRADLHHLFTCEPDCNSFRSNIPYFDFEPFLTDNPDVDAEVIRGECGQRVGDKFEPEFNHSVVARATLYFLLRYPGKIGDETRELQKERLQVLLAWHNANKPNRYEKHRNAEIFAVQGNRNPLIDFPDLAGKINFNLGFG